MSRTTHGWWNFCRRCNHRIWLRAADVTKEKMTKYEDEECKKRHECAE